MFLNHYQQDGEYVVSTLQLLIQWLLTALGRDHPQGSGKLKHTFCSVVFTALVPVDIDQIPYILFTSHGVHQHPPPAPHKPPMEIVQQVKQLIQRIQDPSMTTGKYLKATYQALTDWLHSSISLQPSARGFMPGVQSRNFITASCRVFQ